MKRRKQPIPVPVTAIVRAPDPPSSAIERRRPEMEEKLKEKLRQFVVDSVPENTRKAYASDVKQFDRWCRDMGYRSFPSDPGTVALYITAMATGDIDGEKKKLATIRRAMSGIAMQHREAGVESPVNDDVKMAFKGLRRSIGSKSTQKKPLLDEDVRRMVSAMPDDPQGLRDRALILIGQHAALRRDELERMDRSWLTFGDKGLMIEIPFSKASQAEPEAVIVPRVEEGPCPVAALEWWLAWFNHESGSLADHVFCQFGKKREAHLWTRISGFGIARVVKRLVKIHEIGNPADYSGHSLRRGFVTQHHRDGASMETIMETTRHRSFDTVRRYIEKEKALTRIGKVKGE